MSDAGENMEDDYITSVVDAKRSQAVIKTEFIQQISSVPGNVTIFAVEGPGDRLIYYHWIKYLRSDLIYEFFQCGNKDRVLKLYDSIRTDRTDLGARVYFLVDRDFDDLQGREGNGRVFMTDKYSVENYLVTYQVLDDILKIDFHCNAAPQVRNKVNNLFKTVYEEHLTATRELNFRAYVIKQIGFSRQNEYPDSINKISKVELRAVGQTDENPEQLIAWERVLTNIEESALRKSFEKLKPEDRYRGKFALCFFIKWLQLLRTARQSDDTDLFSPLAVPKNRILGNFSMETIAPKAMPPESLKRFIATI